MNYRSQASPERTRVMGVLIEAAHKTGRAKNDFELREISKEEYERVKSALRL